ncbi:hypothetical protein B6N60_01297 [Richelia sinica FACHB-800]|uniref:Uncharacterized protein n=1 Tax=Richelia sinica FACHB-800 TaxID=1357546 RepID=A0A975T5P6_9NOST|nr:hypothetical protein [Richelia sinica]QXE22612.1 hypothetical protein B6N60_01297 [Richelia sinica FACHB-800]
MSLPKTKEQPLYPQNHRFIAEFTRADLGSISAVLGASYRS